jgi:hypothetical protein
LNIRHLFVTKKEKNKKNDKDGNNWYIFDSC